MSRKSREVQHRQDLELELRTAQKTLVVTSASLLVTSALLVVTRTLVVAPGIATSNNVRY